MTARVSSYFLGGTIGMSGHGGGVVDRLGPAELLGSVPGLADADVEVDARELRRTPSAGLTAEDVLGLLAEAEQSQADGIVVVQGTDTLEETAFLADLLWASDVPLVFTGAMRNPTMAGADGPANLLAAVRTAASPQARGLGSLVVLADEIHAARHVAKRHTTSIAAFGSPNAGPLGRIVEDAVILTARVPRRPALARPTRIDARVPVVVSVFDDDGVLLEGLDGRCDGLVIAGFGAGHVPAGVADRLGDLAGRMPVVLASRIGAGPVLTATYGAVGSETDLIARGLIPAGLLDAYKARLLLRVLLGNGAGRAGIAAGFDSART